MPNPKRELELILSPLKGIVPNLYQEMLDQILKLFESRVKEIIGEEGKSDITNITSKSRESRKQIKEMEVYFKNALRKEQLSKLEKEIK